MDLRIHSERDSLFHLGCGGRYFRAAFSTASDEQIDTALRRIGAVLRDAKAARAGKPA